MMTDSRFCMALDLIDDPALIGEYKRYHAAGQAWPEITDSIKSAGIVDMQIYLLGNRLFMMMDVDESFSFEAKDLADANNVKVQQWEALMLNFQQPLKWAEPGQKWMPMELIYQLPG
ncbi:MAG: L-rhamnose mutarotase [Pseudomonadales bacterium]